MWDRHRSVKLRISTYISFNPLIHLPTHPSTHLFIYPSIQTPIKTSAKTAIYPSKQPSIDPSIHPSPILPSIQTSTHLSTHPSTHSPIYPLTKTKTDPVEAWVGCVRPGLRETESCALTIVISCLDFPIQIHIACFLK